MCHMVQPKNKQTIFFKIVLKKKKNELEHKCKLQTWRGTETWVHSYCFCCWWYVSCRSHGPLTWPRSQRTWKENQGEGSSYKPGPAQQWGKPLGKQPGMRVQDGNWFTSTPKWPTVILCGQPKQKHSGKSSSAQLGWHTPKPVGYRLRLGVLPPQKTSFTKEKIKSLADTTLKKVGVTSWGKDDPHEPGKDPAALLWYSHQECMSAVQTLGNLAEQHPAEWKIYTL